MINVKIKFCSQCGSPEVRFTIPEGDNRPRYICGKCDFIHYQNPNIVAGCLVTHEDKILLCKRAIEPRKGLWTLPAGFMENNETAEQAAQRETWEEARAKVNVHGLYTVFNLPHINQVYMIYRGDLVANAFEPGPESLEVDLYAIDDLPWDELAFATIRETLRLYIEDVNRGKFGLHTADIIRPWVLLDSQHARLSNLRTK